MCACCAFFTLRLECLSACSSAFAVACVGCRFHVWATASWWRWPAKCGRWPMTDCAAHCMAAVHHVVVAVSSGECVLRCVAGSWGARSIVGHQGRANLQSPTFGVTSFLRLCIGVGGRQELTEHGHVVGVTEPTVQRIVTESMYARNRQSYDARRCLASYDWQMTGPAGPQNRTGK